MVHQRALFLAAISLLALDLFILDFLTPRGVAVWLLYVGVILLSLWLSDRRATYLTTVLCTVLTIGTIGRVFFSTEKSDPAIPLLQQLWTPLLNRLLAVFAFWITAFLGLAARRTRELEKANVALKQEMERRHQLEASLLMTQRLESLGILAGGIAHDFNNLLTPILMATKLLKEDRSTLERQQLLATLQASAERGADMVKKLLAFAGNTENQPTVSHPEPIIREIKAILDHTFPKTISLVLELAPDLKPVIADTTQLSQVLMNLCINARDAMPNGGTLTIRAERVRLDENSSQRHPEAHPGLYLCISVADEGMGIPPEIVHRVFDPFFTTKGPGKGTGLGLSTSLGIVRSFGGFIDLASQVGKGTRFSVYLRLAREDQGHTPERESAEICEGHGELILLVDDEPLILKTTRATLENHGYRVVTAEEGTEAVSLFKRHQGEIRAAIVDLMMPGMDGLSTMVALEEANAEFPLIASSGFPVSGQLAREIAAGKKAFLAKPYSDGQILNVLANALGRS